MKTKEQILHEHAQENGRKGGLACVPKGVAVLSPEERVERASQAGTALWTGMSAEERSAAMKARWETRRENNRKKRELAIDAVICL